ncbi:MAG: AI-2E family transporter YdiK [Rubrivivax sp.]|jgi:predicted PurR-regulated permease PerM
MKSLQRDLTRTVLAVLCLALLIGASGWVLRPFLGPLIWATMIVVATWPLLVRLERSLGGRRGWAVTVMTLLLLLLFVVPLTMAIVTIVGNADRLIEWARLASTWELPEQPPAWLVQLPVVGGMLESLWAQASDLGLRGLLARLSPYAGDVTRWFVGEVGSLGFLLLQFLMTVVVAAVLYSHAEESAALAHRVAGRLAGERGRDAVQLAGLAIRGVALGVGVTAIVQSLLGGLGLALAGIPFAGLLTAVMFMLCIAQIGPVPVLVPAAVWLFWNDQTVWGVVLLVLAGVVATLDNVLRPVLIRMGADLSLLLIFAGVIGGLLAFGLVGIFVGPVVLAVAWRLLQAWIEEDAPRAHSDAG